MTPSRGLSVDTYNIHTGPEGAGPSKMNRARELEDTPTVRGMVNKISHRVAIIEECG